jgi:hypothetical protein
LKGDEISLFIDKDLETSYPITDCYIKKIKLIENDFKIHEPGQKSWGEGRG